MPRGVDVCRYPEKLKLVLLRLNLSRSRLAQLLQTDKSAVSRWIAGRALPTEDRLRALTQLVASEVPDFSRVDWDARMEQFAARLGMRDAVANGLARVASSADPGPVLHGAHFGALVVGREAALRAAAAYRGHWRMFRSAFANDGSLVTAAFEIAVRNGALAFRCADGYFRYGGEVFCLGGKLFCLGAEQDRQDELVMMILNSVNWPRAGRLDGVICGIAGDSGRTPGAMRVVLEFVRDGEADADENERLWQSLSSDARYLYDDDPVLREAGTIADKLRSRVAWPGESHGDEHLLRVPLDRSLSKGRDEP